MKKNINLESEKILKIKIDEIVKTKSRMLLEKKEIKTKFISKSFFISLSFSDC